VPNHSGRATNSRTTGAAARSAKRQKTVFFTR